MDRVNHEDIHVSENTHITTLQSCDNIDRRDGSHELVSLSGEYNKHLLSVVANILNTNQNRLSIQSIDFINYYSEFFKLLYNTFYPLFYNLIYFNVSDLDSYICSIISTYKCMLSELDRLETTLIPAARNTYKSIPCCIDSLKCSVCFYAEKLNNLKCAIKKIIFHVNISDPGINKIYGAIRVNYRINISELQNSVIQCLCQIKSTKFECSQLDSISKEISNLKSCICCDIKLLVCMKFNFHKFIMFDENVCRLRRFIFGSVPRLKSSIRKILVSFNEDIQEKSKELESVKCKIKEMEECVQNKLDSLNRTILTGIRIRGLTITKEMTVVCDPPKLTEDSCYNKFKCLLLEKKGCLEKLNTKDYELKFKDSIGKIKRGASSISELLFKRYFRCSLQSTSNHIINIHSSNHNMSTNNTSSSQIKNGVMSIMSRTVIDESIFLLSRAYVYYKTKNIIDETLQILDGCVCLRIYNRDWSDKIETFHKSLPDINKKTWNEQMISEILDHIHNKPRYVCLCFFVRYVLLYGLYKVNNKYNEIYMDMLSCLSRSFKKYSYSMNHVFHVYKLIMLIITTLGKILTWMITKFTEYNNDVHYTIRCFCRNSSNPYYPYLISTILFLSSLIENIWSIDPESVKMATEKISSLLSEYQSLDDNSDYTVLEPLDIPKTPFSLSIRDRGRIYPSKRFLDFEIDINYSISLLGDVISWRFKFDIFEFDLPPIFVLIYNYFFNITFSFHNIYHIFKKSFNLVALGFDAIASNFLLIISKVKFKIICKDCNCQRVCLKKLIMKLAVELMYNRCILITKNISKDMRLDIVIPASMSNNITINKLNEMVFKYVTCWMRMTKNNLLTSSSHPNLNSKNTVKSRNWGYDTLYKHDVTNLSNESNMNWYPNLTNCSPYNLRSTRKMFQVFHIKVNTQQNKYKIPNVVNCNQIYFSFLFSRSVVRQITSTTSGSHVYPSLNPNVLVPTSPSPTPYIKLHI